MDKYHEWLDTYYEVMTLASIKLNAILLAFALILLLFFLIVHLVISTKHSWKYPANGNPYRRRCRRCHRHEEYYVSVWSRVGFWEAHSAGYKGLYCSDSDAEKEPPPEGVPYDDRDV